MVFSNFIVCCLTIRYLLSKCGEKCGGTSMFLPFIYLFILLCCQHFTTIEECWAAVMIQLFESHYCIWLTMQYCARYTNEFVNLFFLEHYQSTHTRYTGLFKLNEMISWQFFSFQVLSRNQSLTCCPNF